MYNRLEEIRRQHEAATLHSRDVDWLIEQAGKIEKYEKALKEIEKWDIMLYSARELGNFAKKALGLPRIPLEESCES